MIKKSLGFVILPMLAIFILFAACENNAGVSSDELQSAIDGSQKGFINTNPTVETLDKALTYFSKWVVSSYDGEEGFELGLSVSFTPSLFSVDQYDFGNLREGKYAYKLAKNGNSYLLSITDWANYAPNTAALKPVARLQYDPEKIEITFTNVEGSDYQVWEEEGIVFSPDMTPYCIAEIKNHKWFLVDDNDVPRIDTGYNADIWVNDAGKLEISDASQVFGTYINYTRTHTLWGVIGKDRELVIGDYSIPFGKVTFNHGKNMTIGGEKFAYGIDPCGYICSYRDVDCCPTINNTWASFKQDGSTPADSPMYITVTGGARVWKVVNAKGGADAVNTASYGEGLASITAQDRIIWVSGSQTTMLYSAAKKPLFELVDVSKLLDDKEMTIKPAAAGAQNIVLKIAP